MSLSIRDGPAVDDDARSDASHAPWWRVLWIRLHRMPGAVRSSMGWSCQARELADLDAHVLRDIGFTRMEVRCERTAPPPSAAAMPVHREAGGDR